MSRQELNLLLCVRVNFGNRLSTFHTVLVQTLDKVFDLRREMFRGLYESGIRGFGISLVIVTELGGILLQTSKDVLDTALFEDSAVLEWQIECLCKLRVVLGCPFVGLL